jgi:hypothetical protein
MKEDLIRRMVQDCLVIYFVKLISK